VGKTLKAGLAMNVTLRNRDSYIAMAPYWREFSASAFVAAALIGLACLAQNLPSSQTGDGAFRPDKANTINPVNVRPDANRLMEINKKHIQTQKFAAANLERKRQMSEDSARLLQFAAELNAELEQPAPQILPLTVEAKADMIEKLARAVKEKMKLTLAAP
jgi:hypothetical protein